MRPFAIEPICHREITITQLNCVTSITAGRHEIIVDKVVSSDDKKYVVAVTSNNMICIWKQTDQLKENSEKEIKAE